MIRKWSLSLLCLMMLGLLCSCASNADVAAPKASPTAMPTQTAMPMATTEPAALTPATQPGTQPTAAATMIGSRADALRIAEAAEEELEKLTEVDDVEVLVFGNVALVGVEYDDQYQGGTTDRIKTMVKDRLATIHAGLENVYVTDDAVQVKAIEGLRDALKAGDTAFEEISEKAQAIVDALKGGAATQAPGKTL